MIVAIERASDCMHDLLRLMQQFAEQTAHVSPWSPPSPRQLHDQEAAGWILVTARKDGDLVGFCRAGPSKPGLWVDGGMFIQREHRGGPTALSMVRTVHEHLQRICVDRMLWMCEEAGGSHALAERINLQLVGRIYLADLRKEAP